MDKTPATTIVVINQDQLDQLTTQVAAESVKAGDRVWLQYSDNRTHSAIVVDRELYEAHNYGKKWGFLADNEDVIGGVIAAQVHKDSWRIGKSIVPTASILGGSGNFDHVCESLKMSEAKKAAIQGHVRKHSAPAKRTAEDVKAGDLVWFIDSDGILHQAKARNVEFYADAPQGFGKTWGFWEDRPNQSTPAAGEQTPIAESETPAPLAPATTIAAPATPIKTPLEEAITLLRLKGAEWVRANDKSAWRLLREDCLNRAAVPKFWG